MYYKSASPNRKSAFIRYNASYRYCTCVTSYIKECFLKGYECIDWLCVDTNKGSIATAEKLGFKYINHYYSFSTYPPTENVHDLSESEWHEWGEYLQNASHTEDCLIWDSMYCYIKSNDVERTLHVMTSMKQKQIIPDYLRINNYINYLQGFDLCSNFNSQTWLDFLNENLPS